MSQRSTRLAAIAERWGLGSAQLAKLDARDRVARSRPDGAQRRPARRGDRRSHRRLAERPGARSGQTRAHRRRSRLWRRVSRARAGRRPATGRRCAGRERRAEMRVPRAPALAAPPSTTPTWFTREPSSGTNGPRAPRPRRPPARWRPLRSSASTRRRCSQLAGRSSRGRVRSRRRRRRRPSGPPRCSGSGRAWWSAPSHMLAAWRTICTPIARSRPRRRIYPRRAGVARKRPLGGAP